MLVGNKNTQETRGVHVTAKHFLQAKIRSIVWLNHFFAWTSFHNCGINCDRLILYYFIFLSLIFIFCRREILFNDSFYKYNWFFDFTNREKKSDNARGKVIVRNLFESIRSQIQQFNPFHATGLFLYPWKHRKTSENIRKRPVTWNGSKILHVIFPSREFAMLPK